MLKDYEIEDSKCIVCGEESNNLPLCSYCYKSYKRFFDHGEDLSYCNKSLKFALLKLLAYFDGLENDDIDDDKTGFLIDLCSMVRPIVEDENYFGENEDKILISKLQKENEKLKEQLQQNIINKDDFSDPRKKWPAKYRCRDGHYVRSRAELLIDNWLHAERISHVYEKQVTFPNNEKCLCDFYLHDHGAYIEFWGKTDDYYIKRKNIKTELYKTLKNIKLIELDDKSLENLDDILENYISSLQ